MNIRLGLSILLFFLLTGCDSNSDTAEPSSFTPSFRFTHNWDGLAVTNADFNNFQFTTENGDVLSMARVRYVISDIVFTGQSSERLEFDVHNLVDVTNNDGLVYSLPFFIPATSYSNVSFTFGFNNEDNSENYPDLNVANFGVPEILGGGYHYMQFDGEYLDMDNEEQPFNYHAIRAVDNPGPNPTFPQDTFFTVNLGPVTITNNAEIEIQVNLAEWFKNPNIWDLNELNTELMSNSDAQILMSENGRSVFSLGTITQ
jgi:hypothetical protein